MTAKKTINRAVRGWCRHLALEACSSLAGLRGQFRGFDDRCCGVQLVLLHRIQPHEERKFEQFIVWLTKNFKVVSYSRAVEIIESGERVEPTVAISFDDGFKDNLKASEILSRHGLSACFFVCPSIIGETCSEKIKKFSFENLRKNDIREFLNWSELEQMKAAGHEIGNHTMDHRCLIDLEKSEFLDQVGGARSELLSRLGDVDHFSWPFGRFIHFKAEWVDDVLKLGHRSCASGVRGVHSPGHERGHDPAFGKTVMRNTVDMAWPLRHSQYFLSYNLLVGK